MLVDQSFFHKRDVVIDIETCGNSIDDDGVGRILEMAAVELLDNGQRMGRVYKFFCNPEYDSDEQMALDAVAKHGLHMAELRGYKTFADEYQHLVTFLGDSHVLCHGTVAKGTRKGEIFDKAVLDKECQRLGLRKLTKSFTNTNDIALVVVPKANPQEAWYGKRQFYTLFIFSKLMAGGFDVSKQHSAVYDATTLAKACIGSRKYLAKNEHCVPKCVCN